METPVLIKLNNSTEWQEVTFLGQLIYDFDIAINLVKASKIAYCQLRKKSESGGRISEWDNF